MPSVSRNVSITNSQALRQLSPQAKAALEQSAQTPGSELILEDSSGSIKTLSLESALETHSFKTGSKAYLSLQTDDGKTLAVPIQNVSRDSLNQALTQASHRLDVAQAQALHSTAKTLVKRIRGNSETQAIPPKAFEDYQKNYQQAVQEILGSAPASSPVGQFSRITALLNRYHSGALQPGHKDLIDLRRGQLEAELAQLWKDPAVKAAFAEARQVAQQRTQSENPTLASPREIAQNLLNPNYLAQTGETAAKKYNHLQTQLFRLEALDPELGTQTRGQLQETIAQLRTEALEPHLDTLTQSAGQLLDQLNSANVSSEVNLLKTLFRTDLSAAKEFAKLIMSVNKVSRADVAGKVPDPEALQKGLQSIIANSENSATKRLLTSISTKVTAPGFQNFVGALGSVFALGHSAVLLQDGVSVDDLPQLTVNSLEALANIQNLAALLPGLDDASQFVKALGKLEVLGPIADAATAALNAKGAYSDFRHGETLNAILKGTQVVTGTASVIATIAIMGAGSAAASGPAAPAVLAIATVIGLGAAVWDFATDSSEGDAIDALLGELGIHEQEAASGGALYRQISDLDRQQTRERPVSQSDQERLAYIAQFDQKRQDIVKDLSVQQRVDGLNYAMDGINDRFDNQLMRAILDQSAVDGKLGDVLRGTHIERLTTELHAADAGTLFKQLDAAAQKNPQWAELRDRMARKLQETYPDQVTSLKTDNSISTAARKLWSSIETADASRGVFSNDNAGIRAQAKNMSAQEKMGLIERILTDTYVSAEDESLLHGILADTFHKPGTGKTEFIQLLQGINIDSLISNLENTEEALDILGKIQAAKTPGNQDVISNLTRNLVNRLVTDNQQDHLSALIKSPDLLKKLEPGTITELATRLITSNKVYTSANQENLIHFLLTETQKQRGNADFLKVVDQLNPQLIATNLEQNDYAQAKDILVLMAKAYQESNRPLDRNISRFSAALINESESAGKTAVEALQKAGIDKSFLKPLVSEMLESLLDIQSQEGWVYNDYASMRQSLKDASPAVRAAAMEYFMDKTITSDYAERFVYDLAMDANSKGQLGELVQFLDMSQLASELDVDEAGWLLQAVILDRINQQKPLGAKVNDLMLALAKENQGAAIAKGIDNFGTAQLNSAENHTLRGVINELLKQSDEDSVMALWNKMSTDKRAAVLQAGGTDFAQKLVQTLDWKDSQGIVEWMYKNPRPELSEVRKEMFEYAIKYADDSTFGPNMARNIVANLSKDQIRLLSADELGNMISYLAEQGQNTAAYHLLNHSSWDQFNSIVEKQGVTLLDNVAKGLSDGQRGKILEWTMKSGSEAVQTAGVSYYLHQQNQLGQDSSEIAYMSSNALANLSDQELKALPKHFRNLIQHNVKTYWDSLYHAYTDERKKLGQQVDRLDRL